MKRWFGALGLVICGCGGAVASGVAVGKVGGSLLGYVGEVPRAGEACALDAALAPPPAPGTPEKPVTEACQKELEADERGRRALMVLWAYGDMLETAASGAGGKHTGQLEAAMTGEGAGDEDAAALAKTMAAAGEKDDLAQTIKDAGPHVEKLCSGLDAQLEGVAKRVATATAEVEKRRASRTDRRCGTIDTKSVCVAESAVDRVTYAHVLAQLVALEAQHLDARDAVAAFCAAHDKLVAAVESGELESDDTHAAVISAVKSSRKSRP
jgi:hypothetical protein